MPAYIYKTAPGYGKLTADSLAEAQDRLGAETVIVGQLTPIEEPKPAPRLPDAGQYFLANGRLAFRSQPEGIAWWYKTDENGMLDLRDRDETRHFDTIPKDWEPIASNMVLREEIEQLYAERELKDEEIRKLCDRINTDAHEIERQDRELGELRDQLTRTINESKLMGSRLNDIETLVKAPL